MRRKVHITDSEGRPLYNRLWDDGTMVLQFDSGFGFIDRLDVKQEGWIILAGWRD